MTTTATTATLPDETTTAALPATTPEVDALLEQDLLVEDVSIDGMCGVY